MTAEPRKDGDTEEVRPLRRDDIPGAQRFQRWRLFPFGRDDAKILAHAEEHRRRKIERAKIVKTRKLAFALKNK